MNKKFPLKLHNILQNKLGYVYHFIFGGENNISAVIRNKIWFENNKSLCKNPDQSGNKKTERASGTEMGLITKASKETVIAVQRWKTNAMVN